MKYTGRTSRNINIKALGLLLCILVASYGIIKAPASDTRKLEADPVSYTHMTLPTTPYV